MQVNGDAPLEPLDGVAQRLPSKVDLDDVAGGELVEVEEDGGAVVADLGVRDDVVVVDVGGEDGVATRGCLLVGYALRPGGFPGRQQPQPLCRQQLDAVQV